MNEESNRNRVNEAEAAPGGPPERPPSEAALSGAAARPDAGSTEERPFRRRDFLGITAKLIAGAAVGLPAGAEALGAAVSSTDPGEGEAWCFPFTQNIRNCTTTSPNICDGPGGQPGTSNTCTGRTKNICTGAGSNVCKGSIDAGNTCEAGPKSGNECLGAADANHCDLGSGNTCNGVGEAMGNECRGATAANTCTSAGAAGGNTCQSGSGNANTCREGATGSNTCTGTPGAGESSNTCKVAAGANACRGNGLANSCDPTSRNACSPTDANRCLDANVLEAAGGNTAAAEDAARRRMDLAVLLNMPVA